MKYTGHVPTEQYGFISVELEADGPEEAVQAYKALQDAFKGGTGLSTKEWCLFIDCYVSTGKPPDNGLELWENMDDRQRWMINEIKKCIKRKRT
jgi:hypothetical protein